MLPDSLIQVIGWTLLHSLWQGALIALLLVLTLRLFRQRNANLRYLLSCAALILCLLAPIVTFTIIRATTTPIALESIPVTNHAAEYELYKARGCAPGEICSTIVRNPAPDTLISLTSDSIATYLLKPTLPYLVLGWLVGVILLSLRLAAQYVYTERFKRRHKRSVPHAIQQQLAALSQKLQLRQHVQAFETGLADSPLVIGVLKPVILIPTSAMTGLSPQQLESILAHELAHIRRHDYLINMLQSLIETLLFYHPAVWWISKKIRVEREHACDDLVVELTGKPLAYAQALTQLESLRQPQLALAATGEDFAARIRRLIGIEEKGRQNGLTGLSLLLVVIALSAAITLPQWVAAQTRTVEARPQVWATMLGVDFELDETASALKSIPKRVISGWMGVKTGSFILEERAGGVQRKMTVTPASDGEFAYAYERNGVTQPVDDAVMAWYHDAFHRSVSYIYRTTPQPYRLSYHAFVRDGTFYSFSHMGTSGEYGAYHEKLDSQLGVIRHDGIVLYPSNPEYQSAAEHVLLNDIGRLTHHAAHDLITDFPEVKDANVVSFTRDILKHFALTPALSLALLDLAKEIDTDEFKAEMLTDLAPNLSTTNQIADVYRDVAHSLSDEALRRDVLAAAPTPQE